MEHPDEDLPQRQLSLAQFVAIAEHLFSHEGGPESDAFLRFVLAGRLTIDGQLTRIFVNARQGGLLAANTSIVSYGDVDSVVGISRDLPYTSSMAIFPVAPFRETLIKDIHITYPLSSAKVKVRTVF
jgi:hypothetical protein